MKFLFAYLVLQGERSVVEDRIIDEFWPEDAEKGRKGVYWSSSVIRRCLRAWGGEPVVRARGLLSLNPELPRWHDVDELERSAAAARAARSDRGAAMAAWTRVVSLYRAPYLEGCYMDWALNLRTRVDLILLEALNSLHEAHLEAGQAGEGPGVRPPPGGARPPGAGVAPEGDAVPDGARPPHRGDAPVRVVPADPEARAGDGAGDRAPREPTTGPG